MSKTYRMSQVVVHQCLHHLLDRLCYHSPLRGKLFQVLRGGRLKSVHAEPHFSNRQIDCFYTATHLQLEDIPFLVEDFHDALLLLFQGKASLLTLHQHGHQPDHRAWMIQSTDAYHCRSRAGLPRSLRRDDVQHGDPGVARAGRTAAAGEPHDSASYAHWATKTAVAGRGVLWVRCPASGAPGC